MHATTQLKTYALLGGIFLGSIAAFLSVRMPAKATEVGTHDAVRPVLVPQNPGTMLYWKDPTGGSGTWNTTNLDWRFRETNRDLAWPGPPAGANFQGDQGGTVTVEGTVKALFIAISGPGIYTFTGGDIILPLGLGDASISGTSADDNHVGDFNVFESDIKDSRAVLSAQYPVADVYVRGAVKFKGTKSYEGDTYIDMPGELSLGDVQQNTPFTDLNGNIGFVNLTHRPVGEAWGILEYYLTAADFTFDKSILSSFRNSEISFTCKAEVICNVIYTADNGDYNGNTFCYGCRFILSGNIGGALSSRGSDDHLRAITIAGSGNIGSHNIESSFYGLNIQPRIAGNSDALTFLGSVRTYPLADPETSDDETWVSFNIENENEDENVLFAPLIIEEAFSLGMGV
nr:hypothetical protein [Marinicella sp. W31]MDC2876172.1 hypothetical protein [Marinicella sp. W31]